MASNTNAFWDSSDSDTFRCYTPSTFCLLNSSPDWNGLFNFTESIDPQSSLELLQEPLPCAYEPQDEWLVEFKRLQDVHNRAQVVGVSAPPYPQHAVFAANNIHSHHPEIRQSYSPQRQSRPRRHFSKKNRLACVRDEVGCPTSLPTSYSRSADGRGSGLYGWNPTPGYDDQPARADRDIQNVMKGLRDMEQNLQAETRRRMSQIQQSCPG